MDHGSFDRIARLLAAAGSRRAALGALLGAGALGAADTLAAKNKKRNKKGKHRKQRDGRVSAQAVCAPPAQGVNRTNCDYTGADFSGQDISSSNYKNTIFRNATLIGTDLSSSSARGANFRNADLCGADLSSSTLRDANFRDADLTLADLSSSSCGGATFTAGTTFCGTKDCNGNLRNDDCPGGPASNFCCEACAASEECDDNRCFLDFPNCAGCGVGAFAFAVNSGGITFCTSASSEAEVCAGQGCSNTADCPANQFCAGLTTCGNRCVPGCRA